ELPEQMVTPIAVTVGAGTIDTKTPTFAESEQPLRFVLIILYQPVVVVVNVLSVALGIATPAEYHWLLPPPEAERVTVLPGHRYGEPLIVTMGFVLTVTVIVLMVLFATAPLYNITFTV